MKSKLLSIIGARPQFVKAAVVSRALQAYPNIQEILVHTGQHYDANMSDVFFAEMDIPKPTHHLGIGGGTHGQNTGRMIEKIEALILQEKPDKLLVYGDTDSTLAGALAAAKCHIPIAHVEAGLRSFNMNMPEEINRILTDRLSTDLFCPTQTAVSNLEKEGFLQFNSHIMLTGDVMYDAVLFYKEKAARMATILSQLNVSRFILCTLHRQENTDVPERLQSILEALIAINETTPVVLPLHPRTKNKIQTLNIPGLDQLHIIDPVGYFDMLTLLDHCERVMTDSGGLQKEAYFFKKHCVTLRDETEWVELVQGGYNILTGADKEKIKTAMQQTFPEGNTALYGDGTSSKTIAQHLAHF